MRNYIILNDQNSNDISGLLIQSLAPISKPLMRTEIEEIDGRDGDITTKLGYSAYDKQITIGLFGNYDVDQVIAFFNSEGTAIFSNEPDKYYNYQIVDQIDFERLVRYRTATVTFHVQPFKFATTGETQTLNAGNPVSAEGTNLVLEGSAEAPFSQFDLKGNTEQDTYTGKNLLNLSTADGTSIEKNGITATYNFDEQTITFDGTCSTNNTSFKISNNDIDFISGTTTSTTYYISGSISGYCQMRHYDASWSQNDNYNINTLSSSTPILSATASSTFTATNGTQQSIRFNSGSVASNFKIKIMVADSSDTSYEPYVGGTASPNPSYPQDVRVVTGENVVKITGKNLWGGFASDFSKTSASVSYTNKADGAIFANGTSSGNALSMFSSDAVSNGRIITLQAGDYVISGGTSTVALQVVSSSGTEIAETDSNGVKTFTLSEATNIFVRARMERYAVADNVTIYPQLELGTATDFEPYQEQSYPISLGSLELCKIGTYQDYIYKSGDKWYKHNAIGKYVYNNDLAENGIGSTHVAMLTPTLPVIPNLEYASGLFFSNSYTPIVHNNTGLQGSTSGSKIRINTALNIASDYATVRSLAAANNLTIYYPLATTSDDEITNLDLIEQLNDISQHAHAYNTLTHISSTYATGNVPLIIAATVNGDASGTVTNAGNIYSKPKLTVYGSGDIGIYLNGVQMFQIALGSDGYITIDTALMEAYKDNLQTLKNRQVTGDYSNFKLPVGSSTISFSGIISKCVVENYSRWL